MPLRGSRAAGPWGRLPPLLVVALAACAARASEITFELPDNAKQCFYEEIAQGTKCTLEFQVAGRRGAASPGSAAPGLGWAGRAAPRWQSRAPARSPARRRSAVAGGACAGGGASRLFVCFEWLRAAAGTGAAAEAGAGSPAGLSSELRRTCGAGPENQPRLFPLHRCRAMCVPSESSVGNT